MDFSPGNTMVTETIRAADEVGLQEMERGGRGESELPSLSVVLSFYNEQDVLPELVRRLRNVLGRECSEGHLSGYELIFVNDASTDRSAEILHEESRGHDDIKVITMSRNFGVSPCVLAGMEYSTGDLVVYMDSDLQDPPEVISEMLKVWREGEGIEVVNTVRRSRKGESFSKLLVTKMGYWILKKITSINFLVEAGDFKLLTKRAVSHLVRLREKLPFLRGLVYWVGFKQAVVYYDRDARYAGKPKFPLTDSRIVHNFLFSALISFSDAPLRFALYTGFITTCLSFTFLAYVLVQKFVLSYTTPGWTALMAVITFLGSIQLLTIGIIGLYINAIYLGTKPRPNYIVESTTGFDKAGQHLK